VKIKYLGHAAFLITTADGRKIVTDPYEPGGFGGAIGYGALEEAADFVTVSHEHADHNYVEMVPGNPTVISRAAEERHNGILFRALRTHHDASRGAERGANVVRVIEADGISVCHLGDLGHTLSPEDATALGALDILLVPVGGTFTVDAKGATAVVNRLRPCITERPKSLSTSRRWTVFSPASRGCAVSKGPRSTSTRDPFRSRPKSWCSRRPCRPGPQRRYPSVRRLLLSASGRSSGSSAYGVPPRRALSGIHSHISG